MRAPRTPQIGVPVPAQVKDKFNRDVCPKFGEDMAGFLREIVKEAVALYAGLPRREMISLGLGNQAYGGPAYVATMYLYWKRNNPELAAEMERDA